MTMRFATAEQILARPLCSHIVILGTPGAGKTWLARTLRDHASSLFVSIEGGDRTLMGTVTAAAPWAMTTMGQPSQTIEYQPFRGGMIDGVRTYDDVMAFAAIAGGVSPTVRPGSPMSAAHVAKSREEHPEMARAIDAASTLFIDSINEMIKLVWAHVQWDPRCFNKGGNFDSFTAYRMLGDEMKAIFDNIKQRRDKNIIFSGLVQHGQQGWELQAPGNVVPREFPGWFDTIATLTTMVQTPDRGLALDQGGFPPEFPRFRALVCQEMNPWRLIAKDRSSRCMMLEHPDLGGLLERMNVPA